MSKGIRKVPKMLSGHALRGFLQDVRDVFNSYKGFDVQINALKISTDKNNRELKTITRLFNRLTRNNTQFDINEIIYEGVVDPSGVLVGGAISGVSVSKVGVGQYEIDVSGDANVGISYAKRVQLTVGGGAQDRHINYEIVAGNKVAVRIWSINENVAITQETTTPFEVTAAKIQRANVDEYFSFNIALKRN